MLRVKRTKKKQKIKHNNKAMISVSAYGSVAWSRLDGRDLRKHK